MSIYKPVRIAWLGLDVTEFDIFEKLRLDLVSLVDEILVKLRKEIL